jgi:pimeloyl-ACP methyl ester carboxylesterase
MPFFVRRAILAASATLLVGGSAIAAAPAAAPVWQTLPRPGPMPTPKKAGYVASQGARLYYAEYGDGPVVILLHGGLASGEFWSKQIPALAAAHRVIVIDSRGQGRSTRDQRPYSYDLMAADTLAVMDALHVKQAAVVGWSDGANVGLILAQKNPDRVAGLFAFGANADVSGLRADAVGNENVMRYGALSAQEYRRLSPTPSGYVALTAAMRKMWREQPNLTAADLARIKTPTIVAFAEHDEIINRSHAEYIARCIPGSSFVLMHGVSHFAMLQDPAQFNADLLTFLDQKW